MPPAPRASLCCILVVLCCLVSTAAFGLPSSGPSVRSYDPHALRVDTTPEGVRVRLSGDALGGLTGTGLPRDRVTFLAPPGQRLASVRVERLDVVRVPVSPSAFEAAPDHELVGGGYLRGRRVDSVDLLPVRWLAGTNELEFATRLVATPVFESDPHEPVRPRSTPWDSADADAGEPRARRQLDPAVNGMAPFSPRMRPSVDGSPVRYLILSDDAMASQFQVLADWKTATGMPAVVRTLSWIEANYPRGVDQAEDVRNFIREAIVEWGVEYVLLGGDSDVFPARYAKTYFYGGEDIPTDMYYACVDGNWNADGDDLFGEAYVIGSIPGDSADLYPDVWLGRIPVRDAAEAAIWVTKVLAYENQLPVASTFGNELLVLAEMLFPQNWSQGDTVIWDGANVAESALGHVSSPLTTYRMYENYNAFPGSVNETKPDVITQINAGYSMVLHVGHGFRNTMAVGEGGQALVNADADAFANGNRQGLLYAINCTSSAFDFDCISEHMLRNPNGGFVGSVGSTRLDWPEKGILYQDEFFRLVYEDGVTHAGEAAAMQKIPFVPDSNRDSEHRWTQLSQIFFGDPSMDLLTGVPDTLGVTLLTPLELGTTQVQVQVTDGSGPVEGATVCLDKPGDAYAVAVTDPSGQATLIFAPDLPGPLTLGVRAHNHRARVDSLTITPPAAPHLFVSAVVVDDALGGDGDGSLEAGETARLELTLGNEGSLGATAITAVLTQVPAGITRLDSLAACPDLPTGSSAACLDPLEIVVAPSVPDGSVLMTAVRIDAAGYSRVDSLVIYVGAPRLVHETLAVSDTSGNGNGNGSMEPDEDTAILAVLENRGLGSSVGLTATLTSSDPAVIILDGVSAYGDLAPGASADGDGFLIRTTDGSPLHPIDLTVSDQRGVVLVKTLDLSAPAVVAGLYGIGTASEIELHWTKSGASDLLGYRIYRSSNVGGPFTLITPNVQDKVSIYLDEGLPPLSRYYYGVVAVDVSGNSGPLSSIAEVTTSLPPAFGFPFVIGASTSSSPCLAYLNADPVAEVLTGGDEIYAVHSDGSEWIDGDNDIQTFGVFSNTGMGPFWSPPSCGDLDHDGAQDVVGVGFQNGLLYAWDAAGAVKPGWPRNINLDGLGNVAAWGAAALADVDGDQDLEIFINAGSYCFAFHHDGTEVLDGDSDPLTHGVFLAMGFTFNYSTPAIADVDNDLMPEIIVASRDGNLYVMNPDGTSLPGFPFVTGGEMTNSPAVADLDLDGLPEMIFASSNFTVYALDVNQNQPPGWPRAANMNQDYDASVAVADMDGDGYPDVVLPAGNGTAYLWHGQNGQMFSGWPFVVTNSSGAPINLRSSPAIGNLDGDADLEICFGANDGNLYAFNADGSGVNGFPIGTQNKIEGGPLLWDIDNDGLTEVVAHSLDESMYVWDSPGAFDPDNQPWPMFHRNSARTGDSSAPPTTQLSADPLEPVIPRLILGAPQPNPFAARTEIRFEIPAGTGGAPVDLAVYDIRGRRVATLTAGPRPAGEHRVLWNGRGANGARLVSGLYFARLSMAGDVVTRKLVLLP